MVLFVNYFSRSKAYTVELESLVTQLEEDNARFMKEEVHFTEIWKRFSFLSRLSYLEVLIETIYMQAELNKERYKQV